MFLPPESPCYEYEQMAYKMFNACPNCGPSTGAGEPCAICAVIVADLTVIYDDEDAFGHDDRRWVVVDA